MISDDAPDPRNGKIIQCRVLARTLWVPWAGSLAGPWREAPCHYAAGLHHPHQYPIFGASPYNRRRIDKSSCSLRSPFPFRSISSLAGGPHRLLRCYYFTPPLRDIASVCTAYRVNRQLWENIPNLSFFLPLPFLSLLYLPTHVFRHIQTCAFMVVNSFQGKV